VPVVEPARAQREPAAGDADADTKAVYSPSKSPSSAERPPLTEKSPVLTEERPVLTERPPVFSDKPRIPAAPPAAAPAAKLRMAAGPSAVVLLAISPWGEVYVNGRPIGVSPPLAELELAPGKHRIEVRNGAFKPYREDMELSSNQTVRIKHKFTR
jgi:serine/threonine-protein kinase